MSDPTIPQKPPFEETEAYKNALMDYARTINGVTAAHYLLFEHPGANIEALHKQHFRITLNAYDEFNFHVAELRQRYDRGEL